MLTFYRGRCGTLTGMQDIIFAVGSITFVLALVPSLFSDQKPHFWTCWVTGTILLCFSASYYTLDLDFAAITTAANGIVWLLLAGQQLVVLLSDRLD